MTLTSQRTEAQIISVWILVTALHLLPDVWFFHNNKPCMFFKSVIYLLANYFLKLLDLFFKNFLDKLHYDYRNVENPSQNQLDRKISKTASFAQRNKLQSIKDMKRVIYIWTKLVRQYMIQAKEKLTKPHSGWLVLLK